MLALWGEGETIGADSSAADGGAAGEEGAAPLGFFQGAIYWSDEVITATGPDLATLLAWWQRLVQGLMAGLVGTSRAVGG